MIIDLYDKQLFGVALGGDFPFGLYCYHKSAFDVSEGPAAQASHIQILYHGKE